jgi:tripartite ATP-independent transporter DctM subunit
MMPPLMVFFAFFFFIILIILEIPVVFALGVGGLVTLLIYGKIPLEILPQRIFVALDSFPILAIPLFIFVGYTMNTSGITDRIYHFALSIVGHIRGGLAHVNIFGSIIFAGMSGSAVADASGLGQVEIKAMIDEGYPPEFTAAVTAASATVGPIIPPSIPFVVYGCMAETSIGRLFLGGVIPGFIMAFFMMIYVYYIAFRRGYPKGNPSSFRNIIKTFIEAAPALFTPILMIGGIVSGIFSPTEGAGVTAIYALFLGFGVYKTLTLKDFYNNLIQSARTSAVILLIISVASVYAWFVSTAQIPQMVASTLLNYTHNKILILLLINIGLLIAGCFMESMAIMTICLPILLPIVNQLGIDLVHFGIIITLNLMIGLITPPVGLLLYVCSRLANIKVNQLVKEVAPFLIPLIGALILITYLPNITLLLPNLIMGIPK